MLTIAVWPGVTELWVTLLASLRLPPTGHHQNVTVCTCAVPSGSDVPAPRSGVAVFTTGRPAPVTQPWPETVIWSGAFGNELYVTVSSAVPASNFFHASWVLSLRA